MKKRPFLICHWLPFDWSLWGRQHKSFHWAQEFLFKLAQCIRVLWGGSVPTVSFLVPFLWLGYQESNSGQRFEVECFILLFQSETYSESSHWTLQAYGDTFRFWRKMLCSLRDLTECEQQRGFCGRINPTLKEQFVILGKMLIFLLSWKFHVCLVSRNLQQEDRSTSSYLKWLNRSIAGESQKKRSGISPFLKQHDRCIVSRTGHSWYGCWLVVLW